LIVILIRIIRFATGQRQHGHHRGDSRCAVKESEKFHRYRFL
jgi:hypothetical protein